MPYSIPFVMACVNCSVICSEVVKLDDEITSDEDEISSLAYTAKGTNNPSLTQRLITS